MGAFKCSDALLANFMNPSSPFPCPFPNLPLLPHSSCHTRCTCRVPLKTMPEPEHMNLTCFCVHSCHGYLYCHITSCSAVKTSVCRKAHVATFVLNGPRVFLKLGHGLQLTDLDLHLTVDSFESWAMTVRWVESLQGTSCINVHKLFLHKCRQVPVYSVYSCFSSSWSWLGLLFSGVRDAWGIYWDIRC